jgi:hypothetical protein
MELVNWNMHERSQGCVRLEKYDEWAGNDYVLINILFGSDNYR